MVSAGTEDARAGTGNRQELVGVAGQRESEHMVGSACDFVNPSNNLAEIAFMVAPEWQGTGGAGRCKQAR